MPEETAVADSLAWEFFEAVRRNDYRAVVEFVEEKGCDPNMKDSFDCTAVYLASLLGHVRLIDYFLRRDVSTNSRCWDNALHEEARRRFLKDNPNAPRSPRPSRSRAPTGRVRTPRPIQRPEPFSWSHFRIHCFCLAQDSASKSTTAASKRLNPEHDVVHVGDVRSLALLNLPRRCRAYAAFPRLRAVGQRLCVAV